MMKDLKLEKNTKEGQFSPWLILLIGGLAYLPLAGTQGFYRDDWHVLWASIEQGARGIIDQHTLDRPLMGIFYAGADMILGTSPLGWQLFAFFLRVAGAILFFTIVRTVWPRNKTATLFMGLLFVVYPGFYQQGNAHTYQNHLAALLFGMASTYFSVLFCLNPTRWKKIIFASISVFFSLICYLMFEWMIGLEGLRLLLILYISVDQSTQFKGKIIKFFSNWLPNLAAALMFLIWRLAFFKSARSVTDAGIMFRRILSNPWGEGPRILIETFRDLFEAIFSAWFVPFYQLSGNLSSIEWVLGLILVIAVFVIFYFLFRVRLIGDSDLDHSEGSLNAAVLIGCTAVLGAVLPVILADRSIEFRDGLDRYSITAMAGACIAVGGLVFSIVKPGVKKWVATGFIAIGLFTQFSGMVYFKDFWNYQKQMWWQLSWRAPDLKDNTTILPLLPPGYRLAEGYEVWGPANIIFRPGVGRVLISGESLNNQTILYVTNLLNLGKSIRKVDLTTDFKNSLVMSIPAEGSCLHVLDGNSPEYSLDDDPLVRLAGPYSKINMILTDAPEKTPPRRIFGSEPPRKWCYFFQKASLARQLKDWDEVVRLGDEVSRLNLEPQDIVEWLPFYEGYVRLWKYEEADRIAGILRSNHFFIVDYCKPYLFYEPDPDAVDQAEQFRIQNLCGQLSGSE